MRKTFQNGEKMANVAANGETFLMSYGISCDVDGFQVFNSRSFRTETVAVKAAKKWVDA